MKLVNLLNKLKALNILSADQIKDFISYFTIYNKSQEELYIL